MSRSPRVSAAIRASGGFVADWDTGRTVTASVSEPRTVAHGLEHVPAEVARSLENVMTSGTGGQASCPRVAHAVALQFITCSCRGAAAFWCTVQVPGCDPRMSLLPPLLHRYQIRAKGTRFPCQTSPCPGGRANGGCGPCRPRLTTDVSFAVPMHAPACGQEKHVGLRTALSWPFTDADAGVRF